MLLYPLMQPSKVTINSHKGVNYMNKLIKDTAKSALLPKFQSLEHIVMESIDSIIGILGMVWRYQNH